MVSRQLSSCGRGIAILALLFPLCVLGQTPIHYGDCFNSTISALGEIDQFVFPGTAGDIVTIRMTGIWQWGAQFELYAPNGALLRRVVASQSARLDTFKLATTGTYKLLVMDDDGFQTGSYGLSLQRTFEPLGSLALTYGQTLRDTLLTYAEMAAYTIAGNKDDVITIRTIGTWQWGVQFELYAPDGALLRRVVASQSARLDTFKLSGTGTYTLLVMDDDGLHTGSYGLSLQRTFDPMRARTISFGQTLQDTLHLISEMAAFTFAASPGDIITVRMIGTWQWGAQFELYAPNGALLRRVVAPQSARLDTLKLTTTGTYTLLAMDDDGFQTGPFSLNITGITGIAREAPTLPFGVALEQNYPNPFNSSTTIRYGLPHKSTVQVTIFNTLGQHVADLANGEIEAGYHDVQFHASNLPSGVYFYRLQAGSSVTTKRLLLLR